MNLVIGLFLAGLLVAITIMCRIYEKKLKGTEKREKIINFAFYKAVLNDFVDRAYEIIHKDKLFVYSLEATKLNEFEFNEATKAFISLVEKLMGESLVNTYIDLYGTRDTFFFNLAEYFNTRYENDEVRKSAMENMMSQEIEITPEESTHVTPHIKT